MTGQHEHDQRARGAAPEWLDRNHVGLVVDGGRAIRSVDVASGATSEVAPSGAITSLVPGSVIESWAVAPDGRSVVASVIGRKPDAAAKDQFGLVQLDLGRPRSAHLVLGPDERAIEWPDFAPDGTLAVSITNVITLVDLPSGLQQPISPPQWVGTSPTFSGDGRTLVWLANGAGGADGPAELVYVSLDPTRLPRRVRGGGVPTVIVGNHGRPLDELPVRPDW